HLPEAQLNLAWISCWQKWDLKQAYVHLNKALSIRPTDTMYLTMANFLTLEGKLETAMKYIDRALEVAPFSPVSLNYKGFLLYMMGQYDQALPYFHRSLNVQPDLPFPVVYIGGSYLLQGQYQKGLDYFKQLPEDHNGYLTKVGGTTVAHAMMGNVSEAEAGIKQLESYLQTSSAGSALNFLILCHAQMNQLETALAYLEQAIAQHFPLVLLLPTEPLAAPLHASEAFKQLIQGILGESNRTEPARKYKQSLFTAEELERYIQRLRQLMEEEQLFLDPELSLRALAAYMNLPPNHMSQLLNEGVHQNFAHFVNGYRLDHFKRKLLSDNAHQLTLLALAYDSGFNSKTVFNTFFKKKMGMTPKAYLNQHRA
ncbi:MAG: helix-turn-helix domain-containing protein, partial [Bacteroidota bacterium]